MRKRTKKSLSTKPPIYNYMDQFTYQQLRENRAELNRFSNVPFKKQKMFFITGSSHADKLTFRAEIQKQFLGGTNRKNQFLGFGSSWGYRGGGILGSRGIRVGTNIVERANIISKRKDYTGMIFMIIIGTNDASSIKSDNDMIQFKRCFEALCLDLLKIEGLYLLPCALLPRRRQEKRPDAVYNMYPCNQAVREVCMKVRSMPEFNNRIRFSDIDRDVAEVKDLPDQFSPDVVVPTKVPLVGMVKESDNVHLTAQGYRKMVSSLLNSVNLIPKAEFGFHAMKRKPKKSKTQKAKSKN